MPAQAATTSSTVSALLANLRHQAATRNFTNPDDKQYFEKTDYQVAGQPRAASFIEQALIERHLVRLAVQRILEVTAENGPAFAISVANVNEERRNPTRDFFEIMGRLMANQEQALIVYRLQPDREATFFGALELIFGRDDCCVIGEGSACLESLLSEVIDVATTVYDAIAEGN